ncbi:inositol monophosphatase family protein [Aeromicrobium sp. Leaf350]|uniref:inositol monophosphatase family protein n=1 Tax=Aeromicrobium sp. Leaf350 TaxID=2876565 RepID=UPI001E33105F|nr:inositol monophosphatase family protein [Aeromicrobium sp. Leaf350]
MTLIDDAQLAARLVTEAARLASEMRTTGLEVARKTSVSDVVTDADHAAERLVVETLTRERPDDGLLGEEGTEAAGTSGRRWVIDPVDGTYNFASGSDYWCSAIALTDGDVAVLGAVAHHATGTVWVGGPDLPTTANGQPLDGRQDAELAGLSVASYLHPSGIGHENVREPFLRAASGAATLRMLGSGSMDLVGVATGRIGAWFQHSTPAWDWLPGAAIVAGAGCSAVQREVGGLLWSAAGPPTATREIVERLTGEDR